VNVTSSSSAAALMVPIACNAWSQPLRLQRDPLDSTFALLFKVNLYRYTVVGLCTLNQVDP
jgi:hypothetical protein